MKRDPIYSEMFPYSIDLPEDSLQIYSDSDQELPRYNTAVTHTTKVAHRTAVQRNGERLHYAVRQFDSDELELEMREFEDGYYVVDEGYMCVVDHFESKKQAIAFAEGYLHRNAMSERFV